MRTTRKSISGRFFDPQFQEKFFFLQFRNSNIEKLRSLDKIFLVLSILFFRKNKAKFFHTNQHFFTASHVSLKFFFNLFLLENSCSTTPRGKIPSLPDSSPQKQADAKLLHLEVVLWAEKGYHQCKHLTDIPVHS